MSCGCRRTLGLLILALVLFGCTGEDEYLSVSDVWEQRDLLAGKRILVRGDARFQFIPSHPLQIGGCLPKPEDRTHIFGKLSLVEEDISGSFQSITISDSDLQCEGDVCRVVCQPFAPTCADVINCEPGGLREIEVFEFKGRLRVSQDQGEQVLILEDIELGASRRLVDGNWEQIPIGDFLFMFP